MVTSARWLNKTSHIAFPPTPTITIQQWPTNKSAFVGAVGSNTTCQGTWEQYHPPAYWVTGIQIFVPAANPAVLSEPAPALLSHNPGAPGEHCLRQSLMDERHFVGGTQQRCSSLPLEQNNISLDALETLDAYEEQCNFIHITFPTRQHSSVPKEIFLSPKFLSLKKVTACERLPEFRSWVKCCHTSLTSSRILCHYWTTGGWEEPEREADRTLRRH